MYKISDGRNAFKPTARIDGTDITDFDAKALFLVINAIVPNVQKHNKIGLLRALGFRLVESEYRDTITVLNPTRHPDFRDNQLNYNYHRGCLTSGRGKVLRDELKEILIDMKWAFLLPPETEEAPTLKTAVG